MRRLKFLLFAFVGITPISQAFCDDYTRQPSFYDSIPVTKKHGVLNFKMISDPKVMNPVLAEDKESGSVEGYLWMPLMTLDPETLQFLPAIATRYSISEDKKNYTFTLNKNAKWQDGSPVTSTDYKFTFDKIMDTKINSAVLRSYLTGISIEKKGSDTVIFHVKEPRFDTLFQLASFIAIQKKQFENSLNFNDDPGIMHPIGNGPYILSNYERGNKLVFTRNKNWWAYSLPHFKNRYNIDEVVVHIIIDRNLSYERFMKGDIDEIDFSEEQWHVKVTGLDKNKFSFLPSQNKKVWALKIENKFPKPYYYLGWNEKNPIFNTVKTRTALSYLVDYKKIIEKVTYNLSSQSTSPFGSLTLNSAPELRQINKMMSFNKKKAMDLLIQDGWNNNGQGQLVKDINGKKIPFIFDLNVPTQSQSGQKIAQIIKEDFKSSGITLNIKILEWNSFLDKIEKRNFDAVILGWTSTIFPNPKQTWDTNSQQEGGSNFIGYSNPRVDALIAKANLEFDPLKRNLLMQEINRLIYADQPYTFLIEPKYVLEGLNTKIKSPKWLSQYEGGAAFDLFYLD
ncbi:MAG: ABC transporter substrate-binding protein [Bdellovibrionota bacterium]